jgi:hypothetical protein
MEALSKRANRPVLSVTGEQVLALYERRLRTEEDLTTATIRNYLSDLRHFAVWCETIWKQGREEEPPFTPRAVATPTLTDYRTYLQQKLDINLSNSLRHSGPTHSSRPCPGGNMRPNCNKHLVGGYADNQPCSRP